MVFGVPHSSLSEAVTAAIVSGKDNDISEKTLRQYLGERLASYKVPHQIIFVENIPRGTTGKLQRYKLAQSFSHLLKPKYDPLETEKEINVAFIWKEILNADRIGKNDNFFAMGGNSLLAAQVKSRLSNIFNVNIPLGIFFEEPTVAALAILLDEFHNVVQKTKKSNNIIPDDFEVGQI